MKRGEVWWVDFDPSIGGERRKAMADQLSTASKQRLIRQAGTLSREDLEAVEHAIRVQLALPSRG